jgi:hypothetical protein
MIEKRASRSRVVPSSRHAVVIVLLILTTTVRVPAQTPTITTAPVAIPAELAAPIADLLSPTVTTVTTGTTKIELWWVKSLPMREGATVPAWSDVAEGRVVGAMRLGSAWNDIRGYTIRPGVYTLRFALQPQNGDHMGISPNREFLMPAPAADDTSAAPAGYDGSVELAKKASRRAHPASISIDPPSSSASPNSATTNDLGHQVVIVSIPTSAGAPLTFGLVVEGTIEH